MGLKRSKHRTSRMALRKKADKLFSEAIRERDGWECRHCSSAYRPQCAHLVSRRYNATRWNLGNAVCLCQRCHMKFTWDTLAWEEWCNERFGEARLKNLKLMARQGVAKVDLERVVEVLGGK